MAAPGFDKFDPATAYASLGRLLRADSEADINAARPEVVVRPAPPPPALPPKPCGIKPPGIGIDNFGHPKPDSETLEILGLNDSQHDWCDINRIMKKLKYAQGDKVKLIPRDTNVKAAANEISTRIKAIFPKICELPSEDKLLTNLYGEKNQLTNKVISNFSDTDQHQNIAKNYHNETHIPYSDVNEFIEKMVLDHKPFIMDHHKISKELCSFGQVGINTIAKAYDRTTTNAADYCNVLDETKYEEPVLTKAAGELFFFDAIYITDNMKLKWKAKYIKAGTGGTAPEDVEGIIDINKMIETKSSNKIENLTTAVIAFFKGLSGEALISKTTKDIIRDCYGLDIATFADADINQYLLALTDLKRLGDLLQIKLAQIRGRTFISTDRVSIAIASYGYGIKCIRTALASAGTSEGTSASIDEDADEDADEGIADTRSNRVIAFYNFKDLGGGLDDYYKSMITKYKDYYTFLQELKKQSIDTEEQLTNIQHLYENYKKLNLDPFDIKAVTSERESRHIDKKARIENPNLVIKLILQRRIIYIYLKLLSAVLNFLKNLEVPTDLFSDISTTVSVEEQFNKIKQKYIEERLPFPDTLIKKVDNGRIKEELTNVYTHIVTLTKSLSNTGSVIQTEETKLNNALQHIKDNISSISLFGFTDTISEYITEIYNFTDLLRDTAYIANINGIDYKVNVNTGRSAQRFRKILNDYENYIYITSKEYFLIPLKGGSKKKKHHKKFSGGATFRMPIDLIEPLTQPENILDLVFAKLITEVNLQPFNQKLLALYMELKLITDQLNFDIFSVREADESEIIQQKKLDLHNYIKNIAYTIFFRETKKVPTPTLKIIIDIIPIIWKEIATNSEQIMQNFISPLLGSTGRGLQQSADISWALTKKGVEGLKTYGPPIARAAAVRASSAAAAAAAGTIKIVNIGGLIVYIILAFMLNILYAATPRIKYLAQTSIKIGISALRANASKVAATSLVGISGVTGNMVYKSLVARQAARLAEAQASEAAAEVIAEAATRAAAEAAEAASAAARDAEQALIESINIILKTLGSKYTEAISSDILSTLQEYVPHIFGVVIVIYVVNIIYNRIPKTYKRGISSNTEYDFLSGLFSGLLSDEYDQWMLPEASHGGNKKSKQPVKGGKSKKEDKKKDEQSVKGGKSKKEMKENAKTKKNTKSDDKKK